MPEDKIQKVEVAVACFLVFVWIFLECQSAYINERIS